jgi:hypothetical protein
MFKSFQILLLKPKDELICEMLEALKLQGASRNDNIWNSWPEGRRNFHFDIFADSSLTSLAATIAVIPSTVSRCGLNSTTSPATTLPCRLWMMLRASRKERPPGSIWDTPGANAGSRLSKSIEMYTPLTPSPSFCQRTY